MVRDTGMLSGSLVCDVLEGVFDGWREVLGVSMDR